jgi:hypothetical protein
LKTVLLFAMSSLLLLSGCATPDTRAERARFACYDARGRFAATVTTQAECERRFWTWREVTE